MANPERDPADAAPHTEPSPTPTPPPPDGRPPAPEGQPPEASGARPVTAETSPVSDTLLSAPTVASREDLALDDRLAVVERRLDELSRRVDRLERLPRASNRPIERGYAFWLIFLAGLAIAWQILALFR